MDYGLVVSSAASALASRLDTNDRGRRLGSMRSLQTGLEIGALSCSNSTAGLTMKRR